MGDCFFSEARFNIYSGWWR